MTLTVASCGSTNKLIEYDFRGATLSINAPVAPLPVIEGYAEDGMIDSSHSPFEALMLAMPKVVKSVRMHNSKKRLDSADEQVDVALLVANGILANLESKTGLRPAAEDDIGDFTLHLDIQRHGISAGGSVFSGKLRFFVDANLKLIDNASNGSIWIRRVEIGKTLSEYGLFSNLKATKDLSKMDEAEMIEMLETISRYCADGILQVLKRELNPQG